MNSEETTKKIEEMNGKLDAIYTSVEKTRRYFKITLVITVALFVLPLIGLLFAIPSYLNTLSTITSF